MSNLEEAIALATRAHQGQTDKAGTPYILHRSIFAHKCSQKLPASTTDFGVFVSTGVTSGQTSLTKFNLTL